MSWLEAMAAEGTLAEEEEEEEIHEMEKKKDDIKEATNETSEIQNNLIDQKQENSPPPEQPSQIKKEQRKNGFYTGPATKECVSFVHATKKLDSSRRIYYDSGLTNLDNQLTTVQNIASKQLQVTGEMTKTASSANVMYKHMRKTILQIPIPHTLSF